MTAAAVIALLASPSSQGSASGGVGAPSGDSGAQRWSTRVAGAVQTAGSSVWPTALIPGTPDTRNRFAESGVLGRRTATRTSEVALGSGGEADFQGGDAHEHSVLSGEVRLHMTRRGCASARRGLAYYIAATNRWRVKMGAEEWADHNRFSSRPALTCPRIRYLARLWQHKAHAARLLSEHWLEKMYDKWRCIHENEGAWNDPNPPHYGGLQFDDSFQRTYGPEFYRRWGDASHWPVYAQLIAAERAYRTRGFYPWPNTARACGLI